MVAIWFWMGYYDLPIRLREIVMSDKWEQFQESYNSRYLLAVRIRGPQTSPAKPATAERAEVPEYTFIEVESSVYEKETGKQIRASVKSVSVLSEDVEAAKSKGFAAAKFWASTSF